MWIKLFDFKVKYILGKKYSVVDGLSRKPATKSDYEDIEQEGEIDDWIDAALFPVRAIWGWEESEILDPAFAWSDDSKKVAYYLKTLHRPGGMSLVEFPGWKRHVLEYIIRDSRLFRRPTR